MKNLEKVREKVSQLNIIDDTLFQKMAEDKDFCEEMISTIVGQEIKIVRVIPQDSIKNLQGRSVIVDALCERADGTLYNVEVQKKNQDDHQRRVRYNASCITANMESPGEQFRDVPELTVIYISRFDMFKKGKTVYHVMRTLKETGDEVQNGLEEIYVNTKVDDGSDIARLMEIFTKTDSYDFKRFPRVSKRKAQFKEEEKGEEVMCEIVEEYAKEYAQECIKEKEADMVRKMLENEIPIEKIIKIAEQLTPEEIEELAAAVNQDCETINPG